MSKSAAPSGLLIKVEKNLLGAHSKDDRVLGYYDRVEFRPVARWLDYSPRSTSAQSGTGKTVAEPRSGPQTLSFYPIKLLFPKAEIMRTLKKTADLDYASWQKLPAASDEAEDGQAEFFQRYPCVSVALINLTDEFKGGFPRDVCDGLLRRFVKVIGKFQSEIDQKEGEHSFQNAHCCVLPTLGYSDYCVLFAEENWHVAPLLMEYLHSAFAVPPREDSKVPVLSTDYVMPIYHLAKEPKPGAFGTDICLSVRVNLQPGVSMRMLRQRVKRYADVHQISGAADCLLVSKSAQAMDKMLRMLTPEHEQGDQGLIPLALSTETFLQRQLQGADFDTARPRKRKRPTLVAKRLQGLQQTLRNYGTLLERECRHTRQLHAIYDQLSVMDSICGGLHNRSLQLIMDDWLAAFDASLKRNIYLIQHSQQAGLSRGELWGQTEDALTLFINEVGSFLADLSRSDCFFIESEQYNHPSVGSATALLIAYNRWQNGFAKAVMGKNAVSSYSFLVRSGGCDSTHTGNLFWYLSPEMQRGRVREHLPLITQMSEAGLFDCPGSIFRMAHECMHYCGDRQRRARVKYLLHFTAAYYAHVIAQAVFGENLIAKPLLEYLDRPCFRVDQGQKDKLRKKWEWAHSKFRTEIDAELYRYLDQAFQAEWNSWEEPDYMTRRFREWVEGMLTLLFSQNSQEAGERKTAAEEFVEFLYEKQTAAAADFYEECYAMASSEGWQQDMSFCVPESRRFQQYSTGELEDRTLLQAISFSLEQLLISPHRTVEDSPVLPLRKCNVYDVVGSLIFDCFSETFADVSAYLRLEPSFADYILAFVFETWDIGKVGVPATYRIPPVLKLCFPGVLENGTLNDQAKRELRRAISRLEGQGMEAGRIDPKLLIRDLERMLNDYAKVQDREGKYLEAYLEHCVKQYKKRVRGEDALAPYRKVFQKVSAARNKGAAVNVSVEMFSALTSTLEGGR